MKPTIEWDVGDIDRLINAAIQETVDLEYKSSTALTNTPANKKEMSKDVSAMANASGGRIVYGVLEDKNHYPTRRDDGVDPGLVSKEWIEDVLWSNITPKIAGVVIHPIRFTDSPLRVGYVIEVPQGMKAHIRQMIVDIIAG
jgi:predicted HTH transcriptional regulator